MRGRRARRGRAARRARAPRPRRAQRSARARARAAAAARRGHSATRATPATMPAPARAASRRRPAIAARLTSERPLHERAKGRGAVFPRCFFNPWLLAASVVLRGGGGDAPGPRAGAVRCAGGQLRERRTWWKAPIPAAPSPQNNRNPVARRRGARARAHVLTRPLRPITSARAAAVEARAHILSLLGGRRLSCSTQGTERARRFWRRRRSIRRRAVSSSSRRAQPGQRQRCTPRCASWRRWPAARRCASGCGLRPWRRRRRPAPTAADCCDIWPAPAAPAWSPAPLPPRPGRRRSRRTGAGPNAAAARGALPCRRRKCAAQHARLL